MFIFELLLFGLREKHKTGEEPERGKFVRCEVKAVSYKEAETLVKSIFIDTEFIYDIEIQSIRSANL